MKFKSLAEFEQTLDEKQRAIFKQARKGRFEASVIKGFETLPGFELRDLVEKNTCPVKIIDNKYDGPEDRFETLKFNPDHPLNQFASFLMEKYGRTFGLLVMAAYLFSKKESKWLLDSINVLYTLNAKTDDWKK